MASLFQHANLVNDVLVQVDVAEGFVVIEHIEYVVEEEEYTTHVDQEFKHAEVGELTVESVETVDFEQLHVVFDEGEDALYYNKM